MKISYHNKIDLFIIYKHSIELKKNQKKMWENGLLLLFYYKISCLMFQSFKSDIKRRKNNTNERGHRTMHSSLFFFACMYVRFTFFVLDKLLYYYTDVDI